MKIDIALRVNYYSLPEEKTASRIILLITPQRAVMYDVLIKISPLSISALLLIVLCGCTPLPPQNGILWHYDDLRESKDLLLRYHDQSPELPPLTQIIWFDELEWIAPQSVDPELRAELQQLCQERLRRWTLDGLHGNVIVLRNPQDRSVYADFKDLGVMRIRLAVTMVKPGNGLLRYLIGMGAGNARVWLEVSASQATASDEAAAMTYELASYGVSNGPRSGLFNFGAFSSRTCLRLAVELACKQAAQHLVARLRQPETEWWSVAPFAAGAE
ncbi:hypothetical protein JXA32_00655 [Candidatus Sumerlaeota bacterium]|nr:hypothetical protein [Candidatus Sumerlaeota bacterium]